MKTKKNNFNGVIIIAGTYLAFAIGSGFSTGQEILQYFTVYGAGAFAALIVFFIVGSLMNGEFITTGQREQFERKDGVYRYYAGKYLGTFFDYFTNLFVYMSFVVMCSGAGATLNQHYGIPAWIGVIILAAASGVTVTLGLNKIADIIGRIGPTLIIIVILICLISIFIGENTIIDGINMIPDLEILSAGPNWGIAVFNYLGFGILWMIAFLPAYGKTLNSQKEAAYGQTLGVLLFTITTLIVVLAMFSNMPSMEDSQVPILTLALNLSSVFGSIYAILILFAIYSSAVPLLYGPATRFVDERTTKGKTIIIILALFGAFIATLLPFNLLMNYIYVINGYVGIVFIILVVIRVIRRTIEKKR